MANVFVYSYHEFVTTVVHLNKLPSGQSALEKVPFIVTIYSVPFGIYILFYCVVRPLFCDIPFYQPDLFHTQNLRTTKIIALLEFIFLQMLSVSNTFIYFQLKQ
jgi:hypothetical protein